jgi:hypothetical protein
MVPPSLSLLLLLAPLPVSVLALQPEEAPVCQATDKDDCDDTCGLWFAASTFDPNDFGLYAGKARSANEHVAEPDILSKCLLAVFRISFVQFLGSCVDVPVVLRLAPSYFLMISYAYTYLKNSTTLRRQL